MSNLVLYELVVDLPPHFIDGRNTTSLWGHERRFHTTREDAEAAQERLAVGHVPESVHFHVEERTRESYADDAFGAQEWRHACRNAGIDMGRSGIFQIA